MEEMNKELEESCEICFDALVHKCERYNGRAYCDFPSIKFFGYVCMKGRETKIYGESQISIIGEGWEIIFINIQEMKA